MKKAGGRLAKVSPLVPYGLRLSASVILALFVPYRLELDSGFWSGITAAVVCQPNLGSSLSKARVRAVGTFVGAIVILLLTSAFPQNRLGMLLGLALWIGVCGFFATILRHFASYGAGASGVKRVRSGLMSSSGVPSRQSRPRTRSVVPSMLMSACSLQRQYATDECRAGDVFVQKDVNGFIAPTGKCRCSGRRHDNIFRIRGSSRVLSNASINNSKRLLPSSFAEGSFHLSKETQFVSCNCVGYPDAIVPQIDRAPFSFLSGYRDHRFRERWNTPNPNELDRSEPALL